VTSAVVQVDDDSSVAEVRRVTILAARDEGLSEEAVAAAGIVATEAATNVRKHARVGEAHISRLSPHDRPGVEVLCIDRGPGMDDLDRCLADGYSTSGTAGNGLGAMARLSAEFDAYSQLGKGTVITARIRNNDNRSAHGWRFGAVCVALKGEVECGDDWAIYRNGGVVKIILADGLGHGVLAADASRAATSAFRRVPKSAPADMIDSVHRALHGTRGAAVAVASIESRDRLLYAGLGNITGVVLGGAKPQFMVSHNGTAGHAARRVQEFEYALPRAGLLVMHSDGLTTSWSLDAYPGLSRRHPALIAGVLYRDASRGRDDVCVVVGKDSS
jgi:anti-sigma regulatory factor (Ser/Thr protein kinase)